MTMTPFSSTLKPTISDETAAQYMRRYHLLAKQFSRLSGVANLTPEEVAAQLILRKQHYSMRTFRLYKAAVLYFLRNHSNVGEGTIEALKDEGSAGLRTASGGKKKILSDRAWQLIQDELSARKDDAGRFRYARETLCVLQATLATGLRPNEWATALVATDAATGRLTLTVTNSKNSNGRANGDVRSMFIDGLPSKSIESIQSAISFYRDHPNAQRAILDDLGSTIRAIARNIRNPSCLKGVAPYTFRHQFIANAKSTFDDPVLISALVGHSSTRTAFLHYGKRRNATSRVGVQPTPESVAHVLNKRLEIYTQRVKSKPEKTSN